MANISNIRLSGVTYTIVDETAIHSLDGYWNSGQVNTAIEALATSISEQGYQNASQVETAIANSITGKTNNSDFTAYTASTATALTKKFEGVAYDSSTKKINFYGNADNTGNVLAFIDATDFIKDGMVSNVEVKKVDGVDNLVISFNTDAGKSNINIPIANIFDATNYYTKTEVDTALAGKVSTGDFNTYSAATETAIDGKQDELVSGTNIKTINGQSILGNGNITINESGTIDAELSSTSTNAVQNKVVKAALDGKNQVITLDGTTLVIS